MDRNARYKEERYLAKLQQLSMLAVIARGDGLSAGAWSKVNDLLEKAADALLAEGKQPETQLGLPFAIGSHITVSTFIDPGAKFTVVGYLTHTNGWIELEAIAADTTGISIRHEGWGDIAAWVDPVPAEADAPEPAASSITITSDAVTIKGDVQITPQAKRAVDFYKASEALGDKEVPCDFILTFEGYEHMAMLAHSFPVPFSPEGRGIISFYETVNGHTQKFLALVMGSGIPVRGCIAGVADGSTRVADFLFEKASANADWAKTDQILSVLTDVTWSNATYKGPAPTK